MSKTVVAYSIVTVLALAVLAAAFALLLQWASRQDAVGRKDVLSERLMRRKSEYATEVLASLESEDFDSAGRGVAKLRSVASAAKLYIPDDLYGGAASEFTDALDTLERFVQRRDLAESKAAYDRLIASCMACHQLLEVPSNEVTLDRLMHLRSDAGAKQLP